MPANKAYVLGLTGGIGCGKSMAAEYLKTLGAAHIDADAISRSMTRENGPALPAIRARFGNDVFHENGALNRAAMAQLVFNNTGAKKDLEDILHPMILNHIRESIREADRRGDRVVILDVPLLFESGMNTLCDEVWTMSVPEDVQLARVCERDGAAPGAAAARIAGQMKMNERNARADRVIDSNRSFEETRAELKELFRALTERLEDHGR